MSSFKSLGKLFQRPPILGRVDKRDSHTPLSVIQAGFCNGDQLGTRPDRDEEKSVMIDATYLKAHRTATSKDVKKGAWPSDQADQ